MDKQAEIARIKAEYEARNKEIERQHRLEMAKIIGGGLLSIGSAFIPGTAGLKVAGALGKTIAPMVGKKIGTEIASGLVSGGLSGAVEGLGRGLIENKNPLKTMAQDSAIGLATGGLAGAGLGTLAYAPMKPKPGVFVGVNANLNNNKVLEQAQKWSELGMDADTIRKQTGWFKGVDDKWRYEIPDGKLKDVPLETVLKKADLGDDTEDVFIGKLKDVYDAPELYKAYPQLAEKEFYTQTMPHGHYGLTSKDGTIGINKALYTKDNPEFLFQKELLENTPEYKKYKAIYEKEDFGSPTEALEAMNKAEKEFSNSEVGKQYADLMWYNPNIKRQIEGWGENANKTINHEVQHLIQNIENFAQGGSGKDKFYKNLAGEVEARAVEARHGLTPEQRLNTPIKYDIDPKEQIVKFSGQEQFAKDLANDALKYRDEWVKIGNKDYRVLNLPKKDYGKILHILDTNLSKDIPIGEVLEKSDSNYLYKFQKVSPTDYKFIKRTKLK